MPGVNHPRPRSDARFSRSRALCRALAVLCPALLIVSASSTPGRAGDEAEQGTACSVPAFVPDDDATMVAAYDGLRRGLEDAHLPRVCRRRPDAPGDQAAWERAASDVSAKGAAFVVVFGRGFGERVGSLSFLRPGTEGLGRIPSVYVDAASSVAGIAFPERPDPAPPSALVRAESPIEATLAVIRQLLPAKAMPLVELTFAEDSPRSRAWRDAVLGAGLATRLYGAAGAPLDLFLDAPLGLGERAVPFDEVLARARASHRPILSLDRGRFGKGAAVVVCPDGALLGRVAAEAARQLSAGEGVDRALRLPVRSVEVFVDLDAADAQGVSIPLALVAAADRVRATKAAPKRGSGK